MNGPFFAGVYIENIVDSADGIGLITDDFPDSCVTYNMWDTIGFHDLVNNAFWNFPGRLIMYASVVATGGGCCQQVGDIDHSGSIVIADITTMSDFMFRGGVPPVCPEEGDLDGSGNIDIIDITFLIDYMFYQGQPPVSCPI